LEGPQVRISTFVLDGNSFTKDYVLLKEIDLQPGDTVTPSKVDEAVAKLQRTGHFNTVEVKTLEEKTSVANRTLVIKVTERDPGVFTLGAGATSDLGLTLRGYTGIAYNNIRGTGRGGRLRRARLRPAGSEWSPRQPIRPPDRPVGPAVRQ